MIDAELERFASALRQLNAKRYDQATGVPLDERQKAAVTWQRHHAQRDAEIKRRNRIARARRRLAGLCVQCKAPALPGRILCAKHHAVMIRCSQRYYAQNAPQVRPAYERKEIPYERETELPMICNQRGVILLDAPVVGNDDELSFYEVVSGTSLTPLELLILKEDQGSQEHRDRLRRIEEWDRWQRKAA